MQAFSIGRLNTCDIVINDTSVSKMHAKIDHQHGQITITDLGSTNGTFVNGSKVFGTQVLNQYDIVKAGNALVPWMNYVDFSGVSSNTNSDSQSSYVEVPSVGDFMIYMLLLGIPLVNLIMAIIWVNKDDPRAIVTKNLAKAWLWWALIICVLYGLFFLIFAGAIIAAMS
jgi:hypothetical protein